MTPLREAAQQALEALLTYEQYIQPLTNVFGGPRVPEEGSASAKVDAAITALRAALAEPVQECPHGVTDGNCKECYGVATNSEPFTVYSVPLRCPNCASLQDQNTELDRKLADLEQTSLELCETCGWRTVIPGEGCLNCARSKLAELERKPLTDEEIERATREVWRNLPSDFDYTTSSWVEVGIRYAELAHGIGGQP